MSSTDTLINHILAQKNMVVDLQKRFTAIKALDPSCGGEGEWQKAQLLTPLLANCQTRWLNCEDSRIARPRPNIVAFYPGKSPRKLWIFCHLDVVPPGEGSLWRTNPWEAVEKDGYIYGRGVEDNQQALVSMLILLKSLEELGITPELGLGLVFLADEENGSHYGLQWLLANHEDLFDKNDFYIVPDGGSPEADIIEIAEKSQLWLKFIVTGKQCHASTPDAGNNALLAASQLILELNKLNLICRDVDPLFAPPFSTFTPTRHNENVEAINIVSGRETLYLDCRLLPSLPIDKALEKCRAILQGVELLTATRIEMEVVQRQEATYVDPSTPVIPALQNAIRKIHNVEARLAGIGGATVAAFLRQHGFPAVVWACLENTCHQPNERSSIKATLQDAAVFAEILMRP